MTDRMPIGYDIDLLCQAVGVVAGRERVSVTPLQRKLRVGFAKAERLVLLLMDHGIAGPRDTHGRCLVLISSEEQAAAIARLREIASKETQDA
jgi:S-DNA-T family DNA segregation ATPase FtsK/SpoIIIE